MILLDVIQQQPEGFSGGEWTGIGIGGSGLLAFLIKLIFDRKEAKSIKIVHQESVQSNETKHALMQQEINNLREKNSDLNTRLSKETRDILKLMEKKDEMIGKRFEGVHKRVEEVKTDGGKNYDKLERKIDDTERKLESKIGDLDKKYDTHTQQILAAINSKK